MSFAPVTPEAMQAALVLSGATWAALVFVGLAPGIRRYRTRILVATVIVYVIGFAGFVLYALLR